jgi:hypothetical protein
MPSASVAERAPALALSSLPPLTGAGGREAALHLAEVAGCYRLSGVDGRRPPIVGPHGDWLLEGSVYLRADGRCLLMVIIRPVFEAAREVTVKTLRGVWNPAAYGRLLCRMADGAQAVWTANGYSVTVRVRVTLPGHEEATGVTLGFTRDDSYL